MVDSVIPGPAVDVEVGHGQRDTFRPLFEPKHDEVAGLSCASYVGSVHVPQERRV